MSELPQNLRRFENAHIALWLLKDTFWILEIRPAALVMAVPTIGVAVFITWLSRHRRSELFHNLAVCCWILANITWMFGEFFFKDTWRPQASVFFFSGIAILVFYYLSLLFRRKQTQ